MRIMNRLKNNLLLEKCHNAITTAILMATMILALLLVSAVALAQPEMPVQQSGDLSTKDPKPYYPYWEDDLVLQNVYDLDGQPCCDGSVSNGSLTVEGTYEFLATDGTQLFIDFAEQFGEGVIASYTSIDSVTYLFGTREFETKGTNDCMDECVNGLGCTGLPEPDRSNCYALCEASCGGIEGNFLIKLSDPNFEETDDGWPLSEQGRLLVRESLAPSCQIPASGEWQVTNSCWIHGSNTVPAEAIIGGSETLVIGSGGHLNIDFANHALRIKPGARVLIMPGGKIE